MKTNIRLLFVFSLLAILIVTSTGSVRAYAGIIISPDSLSAAYNTPYSQQLSAIGGTEPYTFSLQSGTLPTGISLSSDGLLSGFADSPASPGTYPITIKVEDPNGMSGFHSYDFLLEKGEPIVVPAADTLIVWNTPFNLIAEVRSEIWNSSYYILDGTVAFYIDGELVSGCEAVPEENAVYSCLNVTNNLSVGAHTVRADYTPTGSYATNYNSGSGSSPFTVQSQTYSIQGGLFMDADLDGIWDEEESGLYETGWTVNLDQDCDGDVDYTTTTSVGNFLFPNVPVSGECHRITIVAAPGYQQTTVLEDFIPTGHTILWVGFYYPTIIVSPNSPGGYDLPSGTMGDEYSQTFTASGGAEPYTYSVSDGSLPGGLTLSIDGVLSGTPTTIGDYNFAVKAEDANQASGRNSYFLSVRMDGEFSFTSSANPSTPGEAVTFSVSATGDGISQDGQPIPPLGFVTFSDNGTPIEGCSNLFLNFFLDEDDIPTIGDYPANCTTADLTKGTHEIKADYIDGTHVYNETSLVLLITVKDADTFSTFIPLIISSSNTSP